MSDITSIRGLDPELFHQARIEALKQKITLGQFINQAIEELLAKIDKANKKETVK